MLPLPSLLTLDSDPFLRFLLTMKNRGPLHSNPSVMFAGSSASRTIPPKHLIPFYLPSIESSHLHLCVWILLPFSYRLLFKSLSPVSLSSPASPSLPPQSPSTSQRAPSADWVDLSGCFGLGVTGVDTTPLCLARLSFSDFHQDPA